MLDSVGGCEQNSKSDVGRDTLNVAIRYVPILKTKAGDRWALSHLKPKSQGVIRPLLELHPHRLKADSEHIPAICDELEADWGTDRAFYLDGIWLHGEIGN